MPGAGLTREQAEGVLDGVDQRAIEVEELAWRPTGEDDARHPSVPKRAAQAADSRRARSAGGDASIMTSIVSANTNTAAMLIGERAADLVRASSPAPISAGSHVVGA